MREGELTFGCAMKGQKYTNLSSFTAELRFAESSSSTSNEAKQLACVEKQRRKMKSYVSYYEYACMLACSCFTD